MTYQMLTPFQLQCQEKLKTALHDHGLSIQETAIEGVDETYVRLKVQNIDVFIYDDEAGFQGASIDERLESPEFQSKDDLIQALVTRLIGTLTK